jgi:hypothetical protein
VVDDPVSVGVPTQATPDLEGGSIAPAAAGVNPEPRG